MRYFLIVMAAMLLTACGGDSDERRFLTGHMLSGDQSAIPLDREVNAFLGTRCSTDEPFWYQVANYNPQGSGQYSRWTLLFNIEASELNNSTLDAEDYEFRLVRRYATRNPTSGGQCEIKHDFMMMEGDEITEEDIFLATAGHVNFRSRDDADFQLYFQRESEFLTGDVVTGTPVQVQGCWRVSTDSNSCWSGWTNTNAED